MTPHRPSRPTLRLGLLAALALSAPGCYDPNVMIERVRNDAIQSRLEEVDLGEHHVTLPRDLASNEMTEVIVSLYGTSVRYRIGDIKKKMKGDESLLKQNVLVALRETTNTELAEPRLSQLRERLLVGVNAVLGDTPIETVGFYDIRLIRH